jgi:hypothetical protein
VLLRFKAHKDMINHIVAMEDSFYKVQLVDFDPTSRTDWKMRGIHVNFDNVASDLSSLTGRHVVGSFRS